MTTFYGIDSGESFSNENRLKTVLPISATKFALSNGYEIPYIEYNQETNNYTIEKITDKKFLEGKLITEYTLIDDKFKNFPPHDILIGESDYESKLCVFPCHNGKKIFEMIIRQNNLACCIQNIVRSNPEIKHISDDFKQQPYVLVTLYNNIGVKPIILSNKSLIHMCLNLSSKSKSKRADIVCENINSMLEEYSKTNKITYKDKKSDTIPHQKVTLYPTDHISSLKETIKDIPIIKYNDIINGPVCKARNICDFINESIYIKKINEQKLEVKRLRELL
jgi:hypothetical protein